MVRTDVTESAVEFSCGTDALLGILHAPRTLRGDSGVLVIVGGPQYRVGSHRQFVLLGRYLAAHGIPVFRFDYRGMGDSDGEARDFSEVTDDIGAAIAAFREQLPGVRQMTLWGLCDAATAAAAYAHRDAGITGLVLLNPWVRSESGNARAYLRHYYLQRLLQGAFWRKLLQGGFDPRGSLTDLLAKVRQSRTMRPVPPRDDESPAGSTQAGSLAEALLADLDRFGGHIGLVLSGRDLTAAEFADVVMQSARWRRIRETKRVSTLRLDDADHTFSRSEWRDRVAQQTLEWVTSGLDQQD